MKVVPASYVHVFSHSIIPKILGLPSRYPDSRISNLVQNHGPDSCPVNAYHVGLLVLMALRTLRLCYCEKGKK